MRDSHQVRRYVFLSPLELTLVEESKPGCHKGNYGGSLMRFVVKDRSGTGFVVCAVCGLTPSSSRSFSTRFFSLAASVASLGASAARTSRIAAMPTSCGAAELGRTATGAVAHRRADPIWGTPQLFEDRAMRFTDCIGLIPQEHVMTFQIPGASTAAITPTGVPTSVASATM